MAWAPDVGRREPAELNTGRGGGTRELVNASLSPERPMLLCPHIPHKAALKLLSRLLMRHRDMITIVHKRDPDIDIILHPQSFKSHGPFLSANPPVSRNMSFNLDFLSSVVPVVLTEEISEDQLLKFPAFKIWIATLESSLARQTEPGHPFHDDPYILRSITIQSVDYFSPTRIGFIKLSAVVRNGENETLPGIVFLRGGSVAILMILRPSDSKTERYVIMTEQPRIPVGSLTFMEIPAGMLDNEGTFVGAAAKQIAVETGLEEIKTRDLKDLTGLALKKAGTLDGLRKYSRVAYLFVLCL
jgi:hypothetical protein